MGPIIFLIVLCFICPILCPLWIFFIVLIMIGGKKR